MSDSTPAQPLEPLLPSVARLVAQKRQLTDDAAEVLLLAADITADAARIAELKLWEAILRRGLAAGQGDAEAVVAEGLRLRGLGEERIEEALRLLNTGARSDAATGEGGMADAAPNPRVEALAARLEGEDDDDRREAAIELGKLGDTRAVKVLIETCDVRDDDQVERVVLPIIAGIGERALPALLEIAEDADRDLDTRVAAALALGTLQDARAVPILLESIEEYGYEYFPAYEMTLALLGALGDERALGPLLGVRAMNGDEAATTAIRELGLLNVGSLTAFLLDTHNYEFERQGAIFLLEDVGDGQVVEPLIAALSDEEGNVVWAATMALSRLGDPRAIEPIIAHLDNTLTGGADFRLIPPALAAFGERAVVPLCKALANPSLGQTAKILAVWTLEIIEDPRAVEPLVAALNDPNAVVRQYAADALGTIGDERAVQPLLEVLEDKDSNVVSSATKALGDIGDPRAVEPLIARLDDERTGAWADVMSALGKLGDDRAVDTLLAQLGDPARHRAVLGALGETASVRAVEPLLDSTTDSDVTTREWAQHALVPLLHKATPEVRYEALLECARRLKGASPPSLPEDDTDPETGKRILKACLDACASWNIGVFEMGFPTRRKLPADVWGVSDPDLGTIELDKRMPRERETGTLLREFALMVYANSDTPRHVQMFQAEAIAFLTLCHFGISTLQYSAQTCASYFADSRQLDSTGTAGKKKVLEASAALIEELVKGGLSP